MNILEPFDGAITVDKKKAHTAAKETLRFDETGLAVSMIIATLGDDGECWGWSVLEFDGFSHPHATLTLLLEVKYQRALRPWYKRERIF
jgi:hypothetical protein